MDHELFTELLAGSCHNESMTSYQKSDFFELMRIHLKNNAAKFHPDPI